MRALNAIGKLLKALVGKPPLLVAYLADKRGAERDQAQRTASTKAKQAEIAAQPRQSRRSLLDWMRND